MSAITRGMAIAKMLPLNVGLLEQVKARRGRDLTESEMASRGAERDLKTFVLSDPLNRVPNVWNLAWCWRPLRAGSFPSAIVSHPVVAGGLDSYSFGRNKSQVFVHACPGRDRQVGA